MKFACTLGAAGLAVALSLGTLHAQSADRQTIEPASWGSRGGQCCPPQVIVPAPCPQTAPYIMPAPGSGSGSPAGSGSGSPGTPQDLTQNPLNADAANQGAQEAGSQASASASPTMFGDLYGPFPFNPHSSSYHADSFAAFLPYTAKIADDESPRPLDRIYFGYNYFNTVGGTGSFSPASRIDAHLETLGFEKTFLDGNASIGMRLPFFQINGEGSDTGVGDLSIILKYVLASDCCGNLLSGGLVVTTPTGKGTPDPFGGSDINPVLLQPYVGFIRNSGNLYWHGFSSILVPTDSRDIVLLANDIGVGYYLYRCECQDRMVRALVPTFEVHVNTPLTHRLSDSDSSLIDSDQVNFTIGATAVFDNCSTLGLAIAVPVAGPRPFDFEALVQFNWRF